MRSLYFIVCSVTGQQIAPRMTLDVAALIILTTSLTSQIRVIKIKIISMVAATTQQIRWQLVQNSWWWTTTI